MPNTQTDNLEHRLQRASGSDGDPIKRVDLLNELAWEIRFSDPPRSLLLTQEAEELSRRLEYAKGLAYSLFHKSFSLMRQGSYAEAIDSADRKSVV